MLTFPRLYIAIVILVVRTIRMLARSRAELVLENLALRQQVTGMLSRLSGPDIVWMKALSARSVSPGFVDFVGCRRSRAWIPVFSSTLTTCVPVS